MLKKILKFTRVLMLWMFVAGLALPLGVTLNIRSAKAATKTTTAETTRPQTTVSPKATATPVVPPKMTFVGQPTGLHRGNTYVAGQSINIQLSISGQPTLVWAEVGALDPNFPQNLYFEDAGKGIWKLTTPRLSDDLNVGGHTITIVAQNSAQNSIKKQINLILKNFPAVNLISYKVSSDNTAMIDFAPLAYADAYLVSFQIQGNQESLKSFTTKEDFAKIIGLEPGTLYIVKIQPLRGDAVGPAKIVTFQTLGNPPVKEVAAAEVVLAPPVRQITPSIGTGEATTAPKIAQNPPQTTPASPEQTVSPSPTPSASPKSTTGGWSKILIALSILIIAIGAAIGGYYGYEWLMLKSKDKEPPDKDTSSRW